MFGYIGSLILSFIFILGHYKKNKKNLKSTQKINMRQTMAACSVEMLYDLTAVVQHIFVTTRCGPGLLEYLFRVELVQVGFADNICNFFLKMDTFGWGLHLCTLWLMVAQQFFQETVYLGAAIISK